MHEHFPLTTDLETSGYELGVGLELSALTCQLERVGERSEEGTGEFIGRLAADLMLEWRLRPEGKVLEISHKGRGPSEGVIASTHVDSAILQKHHRLSHDDV